MAVAIPSPLIGPGGRAFTAEQSEAIRRRDGSLLLEANAGSGKTSVLVERFVRSVLEDGVAPSRILAITFTERAAGELRARVRQRFVEFGRRDAARETEAAWVSTIHGFCTRVLRAHAIAAGLDPSFTVLDEAAARPLHDRAWDEALARLLAGPHGGAALDLVAAYDPDRLRMQIVHAHDALRSGGQTRPALPRPQGLADPHALRAPLRAAVAAAAADLVGAGDIKTVVAAREKLRQCGDRLDATPPDELASPALAQLAFKGQAKALGTAACETYRAALAAYADACRDARAADAVALLDELLGDYADAYAEAKRARAALDFDDLELHARDLLEQEPALRRSYAERFERVMVDELQDSNPLQLALFRALDRDDLFLVGDEQQSIYGFRHADVDVFRALRAQYAATGRVATLATNFRSHGAILDTINAAFAPRLGDGFVALREGRETQPAPEPLVELLITDPAGWDDVDLGEVRPGTRAWRQAEARLLAQRVSDLVSAGVHRPEDVVVLLRARGDLPVYERALEDQGLLTMSVGGRGYWGRQVVRDLCAWLAALANPRDEAALYGVLASPLVGLSSDALAHVARAGSGNAWRAIANDAELCTRLTDDDQGRLDAFATRFSAERVLAPRLALDELLRRVVDATGYDLHVLSLAGGARRLANVHKLLRLAAAFERDRGRDVRGLADLATAELEAEARETDAPVELGDVKAVRLMSVHAAKGLEFPVVCIADLGRQRPADGDEDLLVAEDEVGLRLVGLDGSSEPALAYERLRERARARAAREEERVMYVATTRAQERLIVSGGLSLTAWPAEGPKAPPLAWLGRALLGGDLRALPAIDDPIAEVAWGDGARVRCFVNTPQTVGRVLREDALAPAGTQLPVAPPPPPRPLEPEPAAGAPAVRTLSYSRLAAWQACGYRYYLQRELGLPDEPGEAEGAGDRAGGGPAATGLDPRTRGSLVHALLEHDEADLATLAASWGVELTEEGSADVLRLAAAFADSPLARRMQRARSVHREHAFTLALGDTLLTGIVDVLAQERGGQLVVDYKTDALDPATDLAAYVGRHYAVQRRVYALAALRGGAPRVEVAYAFLERPLEPVAERFEVADTDALEAQLRALAAGLLAGEYPVTAVPHRELCLTCPGRRALCSYGEELTLRPRSSRSRGSDALS